MKERQELAGRNSPSNPLLRPANIEKKKLTLRKSDFLSENKRKSIHHLTPCMRFGHSPNDLSHIAPYGRNIAYTGTHSCCVKNTVNLAEFVDHFQKNVFWFWKLSSVERFFQIERPVKFVEFRRGFA